MKQPNIAIYGSKTCDDTTRVMRVLDDREIPYEFKDVDLAPELNEYIANLNRGIRKMPTIQMDNEILINPSDGDLVKAVERSAAERE